LKEEINRYLLSNEIKPKKPADPGIKYCLKCKSVWEFYHFAGDYFFKKFSDMPTYGLDRETCRECEGKEIPSGRNNQKLKKSNR
tara:strand:+ start:2481 stop:2732 length:252 start_codon:yes stop_codon:yes gene_type:complete